MNCSNSKNCWMLAAEYDAQKKKLLSQSIARNSFSAA
jgi:hypothetical protein